VHLQEEKMVNFQILDARITHEDLGLLPMFLNPENPKSAKDQIDDSYQHGGGWRPFKGFKLGADNTLSYPNDPALHPIAQTKVGQELVVVYPYGWVAVIQPDRSFEVARVD
jgi:hypothetical protein